MIGVEELLAAYTDVRSARSGEQGPLKDVETMGVDLDVALALARRMTDSVEQLAGTTDARLQWMFIEGLRIGIRAGRADAVKTAEEFSRG